MKQLSSKQIICRMAEYDLACNLDKGAEYTGFKDLYNNSMLKKGCASSYGYVYDISKFWVSRHILKFLERIKKEADLNVIMTSGTFFSMNLLLQMMVVEHLKQLSRIGIVKLYVGVDNIRNLFVHSDVIVNIFDRFNTFIPHFIKTDNQFNFVLPHTEKKLVRVDIDSVHLEKDNVQNIIRYFDSLVAKLDNAIIQDNSKAD